MEQALFINHTLGGEEGANHPPPKIWSAWARVKKSGMHLDYPILNSITYFLEPKS